MNSIYFRLALVSAASLAVMSFLVQADHVGSAKSIFKNELKAEGRKATAFAVSPDLRELLVNGQKKHEPIRIESRGRRIFEANALLLDAKENVAAVAQLSSTPMPTPLTSFDGLSNLDNVSTYGLLIAPPDMVGEAGLDHYVQVVNSLIRVYKKSGEPLTPPLPIGSLFANLGTNCSTRNDGLPSVLYDQLADRWVVTQTCTAYPPFRQMIAVSKSEDPTGQWFSYEFVMPNVKLNDFPKMSVWPNGYYMTTNEFLGSDYTGSGIFAFDRNKLLAGDPNAGYVYISRPATTPFPVGLLPADLEGYRPPPNNAPALFATHTATEYGNPQDAIRLYDFAPDFENPSASTFTERPETPIIVAPFDPTSPSGRADISQPPPGEKLDSVSDTLMSRLSYRNFGTHRSLVANQTVRTTPQNETYRAGIRVYELRNEGSGFHPVVDSTLGDPGSSRWIGSAAQDHSGNLAVQYNYVTDQKQVAIRYSGRTTNDLPNTFRGEGVMIDGTGVQRLFGWRWGEYSGMSVDPIDDCTFWITNAYYTLESQNFSELGWLTRIGSFKFDECAPVALATIEGTVTNAATGQPIDQVTIASSPFSRTTRPNGSYGRMRLLPGEYQLTASKFGYRDSVAKILLSNGQALVKNFELEPMPTVATSGYSVTEESCALDGAIDPGETVTVQIALHNTGAANVANLNARLISGGDVTAPGPVQNYGAMNAGGPPVSRPFTFTVSSDLKCGAEIVATIELSDGSTPLGTILVKIPTGKEKVALREDFDRVLFGQLPQRWTRTATGSNGVPDHTRTWRVAGARSASGSKSVYSPAPHPLGVNELVSPVFRITTSDARLTFQNWYELETTFLRNRRFDGSVLEISLDGGAWQDILAAGGEFETGGYDGAIDACCQNPLAGRLGWSGWSGINRPAEFITTAAKLPAAAAGHTVRLRWRVGTDIGSFREGQYIDDILVTDGYVCSCGG